MIDIHCHLLPGIDDGPSTVEDAMALAKALADDGIQHVVCTPHVFPGRFENRRTGILDEFTRFQALLAHSGIPLRISCAGEVRLTPESLDLLPLGELPFLGQVQGFNTMLLEMPDGQVPLGADRFVSHLIQHKILPVIVHPERNRGVMEDPQRLAPFIHMGCPVQVTAASLTGHFGSKAQETAQTLLDEGWVTLIASDAHNLQGRRPRMGAARDWLHHTYGAAAAHELTVAAPARICGMAP